MNVIPMNKKEISTKKNYYFIWDFKKIYGLGENSLLVFYKSFGLNYRLKSNKIKYTVYLNMNKFSDRITYRNNLRNYLLKNRHFSIDKLKNYKGGTTSIALSGKGSAHAYKFENSKKPETGIYS